MPEFTIASYPDVLSVISDRRIYHNQANQNSMTSLRLFICCCLCAFTCNVLAATLQVGGPVDADHSNLIGHKQKKMAGRANYANGFSGSTKVKYPLYTQEAREKKSLTKEEKQALRRQINETESKYPQKN